MIRERQQFKSTKTTREFKGHKLHPCEGNDTITTHKYTIRKLFWGWARDCQQHQSTINNTREQGNVHLVTDLVPSEIACLASSPGRIRRNDVWISRDEIVDFLEIVDKRVKDGHCLVRDTGNGVDLFKDYFDFACDWSGFGCHCDSVMRGR